MLWIMEGDDTGSIPDQFPAEGGLWGGDWDGLRPAELGGIAPVCFLSSRITKWSKRL